MINAPLDVTPVLLTVGGQRIPLPLVHLTQLGNASVDIQAALTHLGRNDVSSGSAVFEFTYPFPGALLAETTVRDTANTLTYTIIGSEGGVRSNTLHGVYWFPKHADGEIYVAMQNTSSAPVHISATLTGVTTPFATLTLGPGASGIVETEVHPPGNPASEIFGAVTLTHDAEVGTLYTSGWIEAESLGYSNMMTLFDMGRSGGNRLAGTQIFLGRSPNLSVDGKKLNVESRLVLLNTAAQPITVQASLFYEAAGNMARFPFSLPLLAPGVATVVDLSDVNLPSSASDSGSLVIDYAGPPGALMGRVFGVAQNTFGFYTTLDAGSPPVTSEVFWTTQSDQDSILTIANFREVPDAAIVTVTHNAGTATLPAYPLQPNQSVTLSLRELKRLGLVPPTAEFGGFRITGNSRAASRLAVKEHIVSITGKTSAPFYGGPPYAVSYYLNPFGIDLDVGDTGSTTGYVVWSDSSETMDGPNFTSSSNSSIATVSANIVTATGPGTAGLGAQTEQPYPNDPWWPFGGSGYFQAQGQTTNTCRVGVASVSADKLDSNSGVVRFRITNNNCPTTYSVQTGVNPSSTQGSLVFAWDPGSSQTVQLPAAGQTSGEINFSFTVVSGTGSTKFTVAINSCAGTGCVVQTATMESGDTVSFP